MTVLELAKRLATPPRFLVVEQAEADESLTNRLAQYGAVTRVKSVPAALEAVGQRRYNLVLLDVELPGSVDFVLTLKQQAPLTPILVATAGTAHWLDMVIENQQPSDLLFPALQQTLRNTLTVLNAIRPIA